MLYSSSQVAELLGISPHTLRNWCKCGKLAEQPRRVGGRRRWTPEEVEELKRLVR